MKKFHRRQIERQALRIKKAAAEIESLADYFEKDEKYPTKASFVKEVMNRNGAGYIPTRARDIVKGLSKTQAARLFRGYLHYAGPMQSYERIYGNH